MPPKPKKISTTGVTRVLVKGGGWIDIQPDSFNFTALNFYLPSVEGQAEAFSGLTYLGFEFKDKTSGRLYCVASDGIAAIEVDEGGKK